MPPQYVYTMKGLGKVYPPDAPVLKDIWLSFLPGAKIGVLGLNGAGKSTLLKIMAGVETSFTGEAFPGQGVSVGYLQQEPQLDAKKDVRGNVEEGVAEVKALLERYDAINEKLGEDMSPGKWKRSSRNNRSCRIASTPPTRGTLIRVSTSRWTRFGCRRPMPT